MTLFNRLSRALDSVTWRSRTGRFDRQTFDALRIDHRRLPAVELCRDVSDCITPTAVICIWLRKSVVLDACAGGVAHSTYGCGRR